MAKLNEPNTEFVGWHMLRQEAIDKDNNIWKVAGWYDRNGDELPMVYTDWDNGPWAKVHTVSVFFDTPEKRIWSVINPDDFIEATN